jgi:hypothetical protein
MKMFEYFCKHTTELRQLKHDTTLCQRNKMIKLTIKIKGEKQTFTQTEFVTDDFVVSKENPELGSLVQDALDHCKIDTVETVHVVALLEM